MIALKPEAERDLEDASAWYESKQSGLGFDFLMAVEASFERIVLRPAGYPKVLGDLRRAIVRRYPYCVFYLTDGHGLVTIYGVLHHRRAPAIWQQRYTA